LYCYKCPKLTKISNINKLKKLHCSQCPQLIKISNINGLEQLYCSNCPKLTKIPNINALLDLYCDECLYLTKIPNINKLEDIFCSGCPLLYIPRELEIQFNIRGTLLYFKLRNLIFNSRKIVKNKKNLYNLPLSKDVIQYVVFKY